MSTTGTVAFALSLIAISLVDVIVVVSLLLLLSSSSVLVLGGVLVFGFFWGGY